MTRILNKMFFKTKAKQVFSLLISNHLLINSIDTCWTFSISDVLLDYSESVGFPNGSAVKNPSAMQEMKETWARPLGQEDPLEKGMATHLSMLTWRAPYTEELGKLQSMGYKELDMTEQLAPMVLLTLLSSTCVCSVVSDSLHPCGL